MARSDGGRVRCSSDVQVRFGQGRPSAVSCRVVTWEEPCESTTSPDSVRGIAFGLGSSSWPALRLRFAQHEEASGAMRSADPIDLAAQRVLVWNEAGERWVVLGGEVAVLQGAEGLRACAAVVRIIEVTDEAGKSFQADIYAEGDVRITGRETAPRLKHRAVLRTAKQIQLSPYKPTGLTAFKEPPVGLKILQRSGLQQPSPPTTGQRKASSRHHPPSRDRGRLPSRA